MSVPGAPQLAHLTVALCGTPHFELIHRAILSAGKQKILEYLEGKEKFLSVLAGHRVLVSCSLFLQQGEHRAKCPGHPTQTQNYTDKRNSKY